MITLKLDSLLITNKTKIIEKYAKKLETIKKQMISGKGTGANFLGWLNWPSEEFLKKELPTIKTIKKIWNESKIDAIVVIGIGGSYIGTRAAIDMCTLPFVEQKCEILFASGLHSHHNHSLLNYLKNKNWAIVVISKSGTTFETAVNFRLFREALYKRYKSTHAERIVAVTDRQKGVLKTLSNNQKYKTLIIPDDIGGRYSTLTAVGLLSMAMAEINIDETLNGWTAMLNNFKKQSASSNSALLYAATRNCLFTQFHKDVEIFATYENNMRFVGEHYKQIFAESEGKKVNSILTTVANNSEDLHSIGQLYQEGIDHCFETSLIYEQPTANVKVPKSSFKNDDNLDYLTDKTLGSLNTAIYQAVKKAHTKLAHIPHITISFTEPTAYNFGYLAAWLAVAAATSAYLHGVNPFDQPGVEAYKAEMKKLIK